MRISFVCALLICCGCSPQGEFCVENNSGYPQFFYPELVDNREKITSLSQFDTRLQLFDICEPQSPWELISLAKNCIEVPEDIISPNQLTDDIELGLDVAKSIFEVYEQIDYWNELKIDISPYFDQKQCVTCPEGYNYIKFSLPSQYFGDNLKLKRTYFDFYVQGGQVIRIISNWRLDFDIIVENYDKAYVKKEILGTEFRYLDIFGKPSYTKIEPWLIRDIDLVVEQHHIEFCGINTFEDRLVWQVTLELNTTKKLFFDAVTGEKLDSTGYLVKDSGSRLLFVGVPSI